MKALYGDKGQTQRDNLERMAAEYGCRDLLARMLAAGQHHLHPLVAEHRADGGPWKPGIGA